LRYGEPPTILVVVTKQNADWALGQTMRFLRQAAKATLEEVAHGLGTSKGHLSNVERGRDRPSLDIIAYYEEAFQADGELWSAYVDSLTAPRPRQRAQSDRGPKYPIAGDESTFIDDVTMPDGTIMPPGFVYEKIWRIKNTGTVPWIGRWLARDGATSGHGILHSPAKVRIPDTSPGETVDIVVPLRSHPLEGTSVARWKMVDDEGRQYFPDRYPRGLFTTITVRPGAPKPDTRRRC
jgi:transcriptional regulator with XRE-family HTH domain